MASFPRDLTQMLRFKLLIALQKLASISNMVAESIYKYATNNATVPSNVTVDKDVVSMK